MSHFKHLFSPVTIGTMTAQNRLLMSAMSINFGVDDDNYVTDQLTQYFVTRAKGGAGMMLVGGGGVHPTGLELPKLPALWDDGCIPGLKKMTDAMRPYGAKFGMQLMHGGRQSYHDQKVAPSPIPAPAVVKGVPKELTIPEIRELVASFGDAARRCRDAAFDFVEIHAAHGYLINQFLAPNSNKRTDEYGGSFENRTRFLLELLRDIREKIGPDFPVGLRINGNDYIEDGWGLEEALKLAVILEKEGADYLHISAGVYGSTELTIPSMYVKHGCFVHLAEAVKKTVSIPVITVGRIKSPEMADRIIKEGRADVVSMGRSLIADPELPNKAKAGELNRIRPCVGCCLGCIHAVLQREPGACVVNPDVGREYLLRDDDRAERSKKILVVGAGPAGLAAARMAALRGHNVVVCEEQGHIGGLARLAARVPGRSEVGDMLRFFKNELDRLKVEIRLNVGLTEEIIRSVDPEEVILATGSLPEMPIIRGLFQSGMTLCTVTDIMEGSAFAGDRVIVLGGTQAGLMVADYLAEKGKEVVVLNRKRHFAEEMSSNDRFYLRERLKKGNVKLYKQASVKKFLSDGVLFTSRGEEVQLDGFDTIVISEKMSPIRQAAELFKDGDIPVHIIGDAKSPRIIMHALSEAEEIGRDI
ncbi:NADH:flavin oxidoreductase [Desulfonema ishimotonii]|uniref:NADH:flavin oxidoreductase n=1 Tax=Desulfonema ishimotonii TaxID=45657 RepID=A0A401FUV3_9BACT|nr:FAD-dependent oxidoreductase [Desulfonema ishimotonii]GBC60752.1 NADH:flavin oxidoreductase [Desulfonema ishimotonii]